MSHNDGTYTWTVDDNDLLTKIINAKKGERFVSDIFKIGDLSWKIDIRPNGMNQKNIGSFLVFLKLIKLPSAWKTVTICRKIESPQTKSSVTKMSTYTEGDSFGWRPKTLLLKEIKKYKLKQLILKIDIKIIEIRLKKNDELYYHVEFDYNKKQQLIWKLDPETLNALKMSNNGKCSSSNIYNKMWVIELYPNGDDKQDKGKFNINLRLCTLPKNVSKLDIQCTISVKQFNFKQSLKGEYTLMNPGKIITSGSFDKFRACNELEIFVDILIVKAQQIEHLSLRHLDRYMIPEKKDDFREETLIPIDRDNTDNNSDYINRQESESMTEQFQIYQHSINEQIKSLKQELTVKTQQIEEKLNESNINGQDIDNTSSSEYEQKQNEQLIITEQLHSYQNNIDDTLSLYHKQIISLKNELNTKTVQIQKLSDVNSQNQQKIESLLRLNQRKDEEIKIINDKLKEILEEEEKKNNNDQDEENMMMMLEINKLKQEMQKMSEKEKNCGMNIMDKIRIGFGVVCLIGGIGYIIHYVIGNNNKDRHNSNTGKVKYRMN